MNYDAAAAEVTAVVIDHSSALRGDSLRLAVEARVVAVIVLVLAVVALEHTQAAVTVSFWEVAEHNSAGDMKVKAHDQVAYLDPGKDQKDVAVVFQNWV